MMASQRRFAPLHIVLIPVILIIAMTCCGRPKQNGAQQAAQWPIVIQRWPGEGVPIIAWTGTNSSLALFAEPGESRPSSHLAVERNQQLAWDRSLILVNSFGQMKILQDCVISGFVYDSFENNTFGRGKAKELNFSSGTILDVVCYTAEGNYIFYYLDDYIEMSGSSDDQHMLFLPETQWWVRVEENGRPVGWIRADGEKITVVDRKF
jgi:hypothetical protein